jgi:hypothetical protein
MSVWAQLSTRLRAWLCAAAEKRVFGRIQDIWVFTLWMQLPVVFVDFQSPLRNAAFFWMQPTIAHFGGNQSQQIGKSDQRSSPFGTHLQRPPQPTGSHNADGYTGEHEREHAEHRNINGDQISQPILQMRADAFPIPCDARAIAGLNNKTFHNWSIA